MSSPIPQPIQDALQAVADAGANNLAALQNKLDTAAALTAAQNADQNAATATLQAAAGLESAQSGLDALIQSTYNTLSPTPASS